MESDSNNSDDSASAPPRVPPPPPRQKLVSPSQGQPAPASGTDPEDQLPPPPPPRQTKPVSSSQGQPAPASGTAREDQVPPPLPRRQPAPASGTALQDQLPPVPKRQREVPPNQGQPAPASGAPHQAQVTPSFLKQLPPSGSGRRGSFPTPSSVPSSKGSTRRKTSDPAGSLVAPVSLPLPPRKGSRRNSATSNGPTPVSTPTTPNAGSGGSIRRPSSTPAPNPSPPTPGSPTAVSPTGSLSSVVQLNGSTVRRSSILVGGVPSLGVVQVPSGGSCSLPPTKQKSKSKTKGSKKSKVKANYSVLISGTESESEASSIDSDMVKGFQNLTSHEEQVFAAVTTGNLTNVEDLLHAEAWSFDFNIENVFGYTVLHIAIRRQDEEMVTLILEEGENKLEPFVIQDALLHAVQECHMEIVLIILNFMDSHGIVEKKQPPPVLKRPKSFREHRDSMIGKEFYNSAFDTDATALLVAAQADSYELVELFSGRKHILVQPHDRGLHTSAWPESRCEDCRFADSISISNRRLHYYQAVYQPAYLCYRANYEVKCDMILEAFNGIQKLRMLAETEEEYSQEYLAIAGDLQDFTCSILQQCRSTEEVKALLQRRNTVEKTISLKEYKERSHYPRLSYAHLLELKDFVAHPHTQQIVYEYWAGDGWPAWRTMGKTMLTVQCIFRLFFWPILAILMLFVSPRTKLGGLIASPVSRFLNSLSSYILFLAFIFAITLEEKATGDQGPPKTGVEWPIVVWVVGHTASMLRQAFQRPRAHFSGLGSWYDLLTLCLFYAAFVCWLMSYTNSSGNFPPRISWPSSVPALFGEAFFGFASVLAYGRLLKIFQLNFSIGPLISSVGRMSVDVANVLIFFAMAISAYALGLSRLYEGYRGWTETDNSSGVPKNIEQPEDFLKFSDAVEILFWSIFSMGDKDKTKIVQSEIHHPNDVNSTQKSHLDFTERTGKVMYCSFHILVSLILLNMVIGLMSRTYSTITDEGDKEWKFATTGIRMSYAMDFINPSPFNLIPTPYCLFSICCPKLCKRRDKDSQKPEIEYFPLIRTLVQRYFRDKAEITQSEYATKHDSELLDEDIAELRDLIRRPEEEEQPPPILSLETDTESEEEPKPRNPKWRRNANAIRLIKGKRKSEEGAQHEDTEFEEESKPRNLKWRRNANAIRLMGKTKSDEEAEPVNESDPASPSVTTRKDSNSRNVHFNLSNNI